MKRPPEPLQVVIAHTQGCAQALATRDLVQRTAAELGLAVELSLALVATVEEARRLRLLGSPTVLVNGRDADPARRECLDYGLG